MAVKLYGFVPSNATFRALVSLFEKDIDVEFVKVHMADGEHKTPEFLARNVSIHNPIFNRYVHVYTIQNNSNKMIQL